MQSVYISDGCAWVPRHEGVLYQIKSGGALNNTNKIITLRPYHNILGKMVSAGRLKSTKVSMDKIKSKHNNPRCPCSRH